MNTTASYIFNKGSVNPTLLQILQELQGNRPEAYKFLGLAPTSSWYQLQAEVKRVFSQGESFTYIEEDINDSHEWEITRLEIAGKIIEM